MKKEIETLEKTLYFTPSIEDIRVGYECEIYDGYWHSIVVSENDYGGGIDVSEAGWYLNRKELRVPYLTKEQIEAEGWKDKTDPLNIGVWGFEKNNRFIVIKFNDVNNPFVLQVIVKDPSIEPFVFGIPSEHYRFIAPCKDINTFRYITKLLGI